MQTLRNLKCHVVYYGSVKNFNDPFDCAIAPRIKLPTESEHHRFIERWKDTHKESNCKIDHLDPREYMNEKGALDLVKCLEGQLTQLISTFIDESGVSCFSERNDDLLMWAHYGGKYKGICLEFDTNSPQFEKARPVHYVTCIPEVTVEELYFDDRRNLIEQLFRTKHESWSYEQEWRVFHDEVGTEFSYPAESLTGIYFGPDVDPISVEIVCLVLRGQNESVRLWRGTRSRNEFKVDFAEFKYTTYLEARQNGLLSS